LQKRPELAGLPVIVAGSGPRAVVTTASYEARKFGVGSAMPASRARRLCPQAVVVPPDFISYREVSRQVMELVRGTVEKVEVMGLDEAYLDLSGLFSPRADMRRLVTQIREKTGMTASVGIGPNKLVAKVASDAEKPAGFVVLTQAQAFARFAGSPPGLVPGIGPKTAERLQRLGITTLGVLAHADEAMLAEHFGPRQGPWLVRRARFESQDDVTPVRETVSESRETTFDVDLAEFGQMEVQMRRLAADLCARLDKPGRTIGIKVRLDDWTTVTRARTLPEPTGEYSVVSEIALQLLREYAPPRPVRLLGVRLASLAKEHADPADAEHAVRAAPKGQMALPL
jgi:DNA polymerase-4